MVRLAPLDRLIRLGRLVRLDPWDLLTPPVLLDLLDQWVPLLPSDPSDPDHLRQGPEVH